MKWAKLKSVVFKTGEFKDTGDPARESDSGGASLHAVAESTICSGSSCRRWPRAVV